MRLSLFHLPDFPGRVFSFPSQHTSSIVSQASNMHWGATPWHTSTIVRYRSTVSTVPETERSKNQSVVTWQAVKILPFCFWRLTVTGGFSVLGDAHKVLSTMLPEKEAREPVKLRADQDFWRQREWTKACLQDGCKGQGGVLLLEPGFRGTCLWAPELLD